MKFLTEVILIFGPDLADKSHHFMAVAQNVADRFDGRFNPENVINKVMLGLAPPGPLLGV